MPKKRKNVLKQREMFIPRPPKDIVKRPTPPPLSRKEKKEQEMMRIKKEGIGPGGMHFKSIIDMPVNADLRSLEGVVPVTAVSASPHTKTISHKKASEIDADYKKYEYKCKDTLEIPGTLSKNRRNEVIINGHKIKIGDSLFELLFEFVIEAKKDKGGWKAMATKVGHYQPYTNLRNKLEGSLLEKDGTKFIENDGMKGYRISTHPDFIICDKEKLLRHSRSAIRTLARHLPRRQGSGWKKR